MHKFKDLAFQLTFLDQGDPRDRVVLGADDELIEDVGRLEGVALQREDDLRRRLDPESDALRVFGEVVEAPARLGLIRGQADVFWKSMSLIRFVPGVSTSSN